MKSKRLYWIEVNSIPDKFRNIWIGKDNRIYTGIRWFVVWLFIRNGLKYSP